jgi:hypothetical protein
MAERKQATEFLNRTRALEGFRIESPEGMVSGKFHILAGESPVGDFMPATGHLKLDFVPGLEDEQLELFEIAFETHTIVTFRGEFLSTDEELSDAYENYRQG